MTTENQQASLETVPRKKRTRDPEFWIAIGALCAGMLSGATYLSQWLYAREKTEKAGFVMNLVCIALGLASYGTFIWGLVEAYDKIKTGL